MSYILDALNKSEEEKKANRAPDIATVHRQTAPVASKTPWPLITFVVVLINVGIVIWLVMRPTDTTPVDTTPVVESRPAAAEVTAQTSPAPAPAPVPLTTPAPIAVTPAPTTNVEPVRIGELPANIQRQIPDMTFSSHIFANDADLRMVSINGKMAREGDTIDSGLKLVEITEDGVVLTYLHYKFAMSVLRDWSY